jgi:hypothetical protein
MRVLHLHQLEELLPIRPLFVQRLAAVADFHPANRAVAADPGVGHVPQILPVGHRAAAQRAVFDRLEQRLLAAGSDAGGDQVAHREKDQGERTARS